MTSDLAYPRHSSISGSEYKSEHTERGHTSLRRSADMASPQQPYDDGGPDPEGGQVNQDGAYDQQQSAPAPAAGGKKKRDRYAGQAYEFGAGANAGLGGQQQAGGQFQGSPAPAAGGYGFPGQQQPAQPSYGMPQQPAYGDPNAQAPGHGAPQGGYEPPQPAYSAQGAPSLIQQGVQGVTQQFQQMGVGSAPQPQQPPGQPAMRLNPLVPVDISMQGQPFHVSDLDQAPPLIILPPNVSTDCDFHRGLKLTDSKVIRYTFATRKLPTEVCEVNAQCHAHHSLAPQEEQIAIRACNPALRHPPRRRRRCASAVRPSHCALQKMSDLYQPFRELPRPLAQMAVQYVQPHKRCPAKLRLG